MGRLFELVKMTIFCEHVFQYTLKQEIIFKNGRLIISTFIEN